MFPRSSGILLHPTSLPGPFGIGDFGPSAYQFVDFLQESGQKLWQILPLGPTGYGNSPYACFSAFAGNTLLLSPELLVKENLLEEKDFQDLPSFPMEKVDYDWAASYKEKLFRLSFERFQSKADQAEKNKFFQFCQEKEFWLKDFSLFMSIKEHYRKDLQKNCKSWLMWENGLSMRNPEALKEIEKKLKEEIVYYQYLQYQFDKQWTALKEYANQKGIKMVGDIPIFVAFDSADVWAHREIFQLDPRGKPKEVAGVPPDYFSKKGQLWGNPLYDWNALQERDYDWWVQRVEATLHSVDIIRIDHFRGFEAYWAIPYGAKDAVKGEWRKGPGASLFQALQKKLGRLPLIAEDLGFITPEVEELRDSFQLPGMKILQFAFGSGNTNGYLPHNYSPNCVVYPGTHDNNTIAGWFKKISKEEKKLVFQYTHSNRKNIHWGLIRLGLSSVASMAIFSMQDVLGLDGKARMNTPAVKKGNWIWRMKPGVLTKTISQELQQWTEMYGR